MAPTAWTGSVSAHVLLVSLNLSSERTRHLRRNECPKSGGGRGLQSLTACGDSKPALNCQFTGFTVIWLLSPGDPEIAARRTPGLHTLLTIWQTRKSEGKYVDFKQLLKDK